MTRDLSFSDLKQESVRCSLIECYRQTWMDNRAWLGYRETPRFSDGLMLICSDVVATFAFSDGRVVKGRKGNVLYIPKGARYTASFCGGGKGTDLYTVNFGLVDDGGRELRFGTEPLLLTEQASPACRYLASAIADECCAVELNRFKLQARFFDLMEEVLDVISTGDKHYELIRAGVELLLKEWNQNRRTEDYARACGLGESSFYQYFKIWSGTSPGEYRTGLRIAAAKSMLRNSNLSVYEIAARVGFEDPYYFSRIFKKTVGMSPRQYRMHEPER